MYMHFISGELAYWAESRLYHWIQNLAKSICPFTFVEVSGTVEILHVIYVCYVYSFERKREARFSRRVCIRSSRRDRVRMSDLVAALASIPLTTSLMTGIAHWRGRGGNGNLESALFSAGRASLLFIDEGGIVHERLRKGKMLRFPLFMGIRYVAGDANCVMDIGVLAAAFHHQADRGRGQLCRVGCGLGGLRASSELFDRGACARWVRMPANWRRAGPRLLQRPPPG